MSCLFEIFVRIGGLKAAIAICVVLCAHYFLVMFAAIFVFGLTWTAEISICSHCNDS